MAHTAPIGTRIIRKARRGTKHARRWTAAAFGGRPTTSPVFIFGAQRSGTRLPLHVLERSPDVATYLENNAEFYDGVLLRDDETLERRIRASPFPIVGLKPICESHRARELLETFPRGRGIWIYRQFRDTVNSAAAKWSSAGLYLRALLEGDVQTAGWRAGGFTPARAACIASLYQDDLSAHAAHALMWYLRNSLYFDQQLSSHDRVRLVRYEDLVREPEAAFGKVFDFLQIPFASKFASNVYASSVNARAFPSIPQPILDLCEATEERLDEAYRRRNCAGVS